MGINSVRLRIVVLFSVVAGIFLAGSLFLMYTRFSREVWSQLDCRLLRVGGTALSQVITHPTERIVGNLDVPDEYFEILDSSGRVLERSKNWHGRPIVLGRHFDFSTVVFRTTGDAEPARQRRALFPYVQARAQRVFVVAMPTNHNDIAIETVRRFILLIVPLGLILIAATSIWYVGRRLRPVTDLIRQARGMIAEIQAKKSSPTELDQTYKGLLSVPAARDELSSLASTFNMLFSQFSAAFSQDKCFISDATHELRTPLHLLLGETQLALSQPRTAEEYVKTLQLVNAEVLNLSRIVEALFTLSLADAGQLRVNRELVYLNEVLEEACVRMSPLAQTKRIHIHRDLAKDTEYCGDEMLLRELSTIFLDNAIKYSPPDTLIRIDLERSDGQIRIKFQDHGYGISAEDLPHIFERFYRAPLTGSVKALRGGLGLAMAQAIVKSQGGAIECESVLGSYTTFTVIFHDATELESVECCGNPIVSFQAVGSN